MEYTKAQVVDYIHHNFSKKGKKIAKKELNVLSLDALLLIVEKNNCNKQLKAWVNRPKLIKFMVDGTQNGRSYSWDCEYESEQACRKAYEDEGVVVEKIAKASTHHRCRYCKGIAEGKNKDLLCDNCRGLFGHTFYSEL